MSDKQLQQPEALRVTLDVLDELLALGPGYSSLTLEDVRDLLQARLVRQQQRQASKNGAQYCQHCKRDTLQMFSPPGWVCSECAKPTFRADGRPFEKGAN